MPEQPTNQHRLKVRQTNSLGIAKAHEDARAIQNSRDFAIRTVFNRLNNIDWILAGHKWDLLALDAKIMANRTRRDQKQYGYDSMPPPGKALKVAPIIFRNNSGSDVLRISVGRQA